MNLLPLMTLHVKPIHMKKIFTYLLLTVAPCSGIMAQNFGIVLAEDFEDGTLPTDWTRTQAAGSDGWTFGVTGYTSTYWTIPPSVDASQFAVSNDDDCNCDMSDDQMNSPVMNLTHFDSAYFLFDRYFDGQDGSQGYFQISYDAGTNWLYLALDADNVWVEDGYALPREIVVDNDTYTFNDQMMIGFLHYDGEDWGTGVAIDNVIVAGFNNPCDDIITIPTCSAPETVTLSGLGVYDWNFTGPCGWEVPGAEQIYSFTPSVSGVHALDVSSTTANSWLDYMYKPASLGCDTLNWICLDDVQDPGTYSMNLVAGVEYLILVDNEFLDSETQTFSIECPCTYTSLGNTPESETCGADLNGGCNSTPEAYEPIACGESVSGTIWADQGSRDTDWYELVVTEQTDIEVAFSGGSPLEVYLMDNCIDMNTLASESSIACGDGSITYSVSPGTYLLVIVPPGFESVPCGSGSANQYDVTVTYCEPVDPCNEIITIGNCGAPETVTLSGLGEDDWNFTSSCGWEVPGAEQIYSFTPSVGGVHSLEVTSTSAYSWLDYMYKPASLGCDTLNWICLDDVQEPGAFSMNMLAGVEYLILVANEFSDSETQTFSIECPCTYTSLGNTPESETCGADLNGGCNSTPEAYEPIVCGESLSGTIWADQGSRDTDWYELVVTEQTDIEVAFSGGSPLEVYLMDNCIDMNTLASESSSACGDGSITYSVSPGTYLLVIVPPGFESVPCGSGSANQYDITVTYCQPIGISEADQGGMKVYPNPADGKFVIELGEMSSEVEMDVLDMSGRIVYKEMFDSKTDYRKEFDLNLSSGSYLLRVVSEGKTEMQRLIIE